MPKSRFFRIAVEGGTTDGRVIERNWIDEMAAGYNPETYTARINCEHLRGFSPEPPFNAYGSVVALKAEDVELEVGGKKEKRRALLAQLDANDQLVAINKKGQKLFTSCEIAPNFGGSGKAGLVGLAITDSPASLGTEMLEFCSKQGDNNPLASRKQDKANLFTAAQEAEIVLEAETDAGGSEFAGFFSEARAFFASFTKKKEEEKPKEETPPDPANDNEARFGAVSQAMEKMAAGVESAVQKISGDVSKLTAEVATLKASIESTDRNSSRRPAATGTEGNFAATDC